MSILKFFILPVRAAVYRHYPSMVLSWALFLFLVCFLCSLSLLWVSNIDSPPSNPIAFYMTTNVETFILNCHYPADVPYIFQRSCALSPREGVRSVSAYISGCFPLNISYSFQFDSEIQLGYMFMWYGRPSSIARSRRYNSYAWRLPDMLVVAYTAKDTLYSRVTFVSIQHRFPSERCD